MMDKKQVAIVGAGVSGLLSCKYCLSKGFNPIVFDLESDIGGVWVKTMKTTRLQAPKALYQFSDFPWPESVSDHFPTQQQMLQYLHSYANHFHLMPCIKLQSRVNSISYTKTGTETGTDIDKMFESNGKWNVTVNDVKTGDTKVWVIDSLSVSLSILNVSWLR